MTADITALDKYFRRALIISALILGGLDTWMNGTNVWIKSGFVVAIAGLVGYFTNYLAIKMLFQPKRGQVFGWRGLVPQNQPQIARSLGENVQKQLLSPDVILAYIRDRELIDIGTRNLADWIDVNLQKSNVRRRITQLLIEFLNARGPQLLATIFDLVEESLKGVARNPKVIESYWQQIRAELLNYLESDENRGAVAAQARKAIQHQLPQLAAWIDRALEDYLAHKRTVGSLGRGIKNLVSFDEEAILEVLQRLTEDPRFVDELVEMLDAVMQGIQKDLTDDTAQNLLIDQLQRWIEILGEFSRKTLLPSTLDQFDSYLNNEANWAQIEEIIIRGLLWLKQRALTLLDSPEGQAYVRAGLERAVQRLNVTELVEEQVMQLDTDELEKMVLDNTGGNLTVIQTLGGMLGIIAGSVQVHIFFALPLAGAFAAVWVAYLINERRHRKH